MPSKTSKTSNKSTQINSSGKEQTMSKFFSFTRLEDGRLSDLVINKDGKGGLVEINPRSNEDYKNLMATLRAASDYFKFGKYNHPNTQPGLHVYAKYPLLDEILLATNFAVIHKSFQPDFAIENSDAEVFINGWALLTKRNGLYYISAFEYDEEWTLRLKEDNRVHQARKHDSIDYCVKDARIELRVLPKATYAETLLATWEAEMEEAKKMRNQGYKDADLNAQINAPLQKEYAKVQGPIDTARPVGDPKTGEVNASILLTQEDGKPLDVNKLPVPSRIEVLSARGGEATIGWDGSYQARMRLMAAAGIEGAVVRVVEGWSR